MNSFIKRLLVSAIAGCLLFSRRGAGDGRRRQQLKPRRPARKGQVYDSKTQTCMVDKAARSTTSTALTTPMRWRKAATIRKRSICSTR